MQISAVIICLNEERNLGRALNSLKGVVDEVLVLDSGSTDRTKEIALSNGARFIDIEWEGYASTKNKGNDLASFDHILSLDADEELSPELQRSILNIKSSERSGAYTFNRLTNYCGKWIRNSGWYPDRKIRLFPKGKARWEGAYVHEHLVLEQGLDSNHLTGNLLHYSYYTPQEHIEREKKYAQLAAEKDRSVGKSSSLIMAYLKAIFRFISTYVLKRGFLDGKEGFKIALISAKGKIWRHQFLVHPV